jgi:hypothetical protein
MRARQPDVQDIVEHDGGIGCEMLGRGEPTPLSMPTWTILHSRFHRLLVDVGRRPFCHRQGGTT